MNLACLRSAAVVSALVLAPAPVAAQVDCTPRPDGERVFEVARLLQTGCLGRDNDPTPLGAAWKEAAARLPGTVPADLDARAAIVLPFLDAVGEKGTELSTSASVPEPWRSRFTALSANIMDSREYVKRPYDPATVPFGPTHWVLTNDGSLCDPAGDGVVCALTYKDDLARACPTPAAEGCAAAFESALELVRSNELVRIALSKIADVKVAGAAAVLRSLDDEWTAYFEQSRSQYVWELAANSARFHPRPGQFNHPPGGQILLLHPFIGLEYIGSDPIYPDGLQETLVVDVIGYNWLRWGKAGVAPYSRWPAGISLVATLSGNNVGDRAGYGAMVHVRNVYSLGVTRRDVGAGTRTIFVGSLDLARLFLKYSDARKEKFRLKAPTSLH